MTLTAEQIDALEAGLEGVTPGPWVGETENSWETDQPEVYVCGPKTQCDQTVVSTMGAAGTQEQKTKDAAHIARCDPNTIRELIRLARLGLEEEMLRAALLHWQSAHRSGKHEPCVIAFEHALTVLNRIPTPPTGGENV